jgi:hypothetical protein
MNQRRLRPGDILDDYCPRERRLTDHAIVAMVEDDVKLTRCTACDTEHEFKQGKMPTLRRKKDAVSAAYKEVLAAVTGEAVAPTIVVPAALRDETPGAATPVAPPSEPPAERAALPVPAQARAVRPSEEPGDPKTPDSGAGDDRDAGGTEDGRVHRRLIRATLPRLENQTPERPVPEFTMRQPTDRGGKFRGGMGRGMGTRHGGGRGGGQQRGPVFGRQAGNRDGGQGSRMPGRNDPHRPPRGGQPGRHGKKHSK